jgi:hypothetical protein
MPHGGRLQAQGEDIPEPGPSFSWARLTPLSKTDALQGLEQVKTKCTRQQQKRRSDAFAQAERFIERGPYAALPSPVIRSFYNPNLPRDYRKCRVDVEVWRGKAFV